jgi:hypothetical protein
MALATLCAGPIAHAACIIDANDEITNPFEPGCGDVILTYTDSDNTGNNIALGYPVPTVIASLTPVDGFRDYASLFACHQSLLIEHDEATGQVVGQPVAGRDIWAYAIGDLDTTTADGFAEGAVLVNGGIHAGDGQHRCSDAGRDCNDRARPGRNAVGRESPHRDGLGRRTLGALRECDERRG